MGAQLWRRTYFYVRSDSDAEQRAAHREIHGPVSILYRLLLYTALFYTHQLPRCGAQGRGPKTLKGQHSSLCDAGKARGEFITDQAFRVAEFQRAIKDAIA